VPDASLMRCAEVLADPSAAVLVGAGASASSGLPTWVGLLEQIAAKLPPELAAAVQLFTTQEKYLEAAQTARMAFPSDAAWFSHFQGFEKIGLTTAIWNTVASLGLHKMVTTNWDHIGEDSFSKVWSRSSGVYIGADELLTPLSSGYPQIIHPHGQAPRWESVVFTLSDYQRLEANDKYQQFWIDLCL